MPPPLAEIDVAARRRRPADRVVADAVHRHAVAVVAHGDRAREVGADQVALDQRLIAIPRVEEIDTVAAVARDQVAGARRRPADRVARRHSRGRSPFSWS